MSKGFELKMKQMYANNAMAGVVTFTCFLLILLLISRWNLSFFGSTAEYQATQTEQAPPVPISISCPYTMDNFTCHRTSFPYKNATINHHLHPELCPDYFRYIHEDLKHWKSTGISRKMVESASRLANFRLVISNGRAYVERYKGSFQTRDIFTLWGIVQLLNRYPGHVPDLDLMFGCDDWPLIKASDYSSAPAPPLFQYCKDNTTLDIVFPDWTFWGWPETNIKPWETVLEDIKIGREKLNWTNRQPYAFWKGHIGGIPSRADLLSCNVSKDHETNARIFTLNWNNAAAGGFKETDLSNECTYRYKIYVEGNTWSVSNKYILACDSPVLFVKPWYVDFFSRGLISGLHYWPISTSRKCKSIKLAVDWGNRHEKESIEMGKAGSLFIEKELRMENVYQYMLHLLTEYAKLLRYKPIIPKKAKELCLESMVCDKTGRVKAFMLGSMEKFTYNSEPCKLPPPV